MLQTGQFPAMSTREAGQRLGVSRATVRRTIGRGELWGKKSGGWYLLYRKEVEALAATRKTA